MKLLKHLKTKYNNLSLPVKVSFYFFACTIVQRGLSFLSTPIFTRLLSTSDFGKVSVYNSWREIIGIFSAFSLATSVSNVGLTEFHEDKDTFQFSLLRLGLLFTLVWIILFVFAYDIIGGFIEIEKKIAIIMLVEIYFSEIIAMWSLRERYEYRYKKMAFATLAASLLSVVNALILICVGFPGYYSRVVGSAFAYIFIGAICFYEIIRRSNHKINFKYWIFALKYNIPMIPHVLSTILLGQMDRIMIKDYCGVAKAGIYSVSYSCALIVQLLNTSFSVSYNPWLLQKIKRRDYDKIGGITNFFLLIYSIILVELMFFSPEILKIMASHDYFEGVYVIPPVACSMFFVLIFNIAAPVEYSSLNTKFIAVASTLSALLNYILNGIFLKRYGYIAAAYTTLFCYILYAIAHYIYMSYLCRSLLNVKCLFDTKFIMVLANVILLFAVFGSILYKFQFLRYTIAILIIIISVFFICKHKEKFPVILKN